MSAHVCTVAGKGRYLKNVNENDSGASSCEARYRLCSGTKGLSKESKRKRSLSFCWHVNDRTGTSYGLRLLVQVWVVFFYHYLCDTRLFMCAIFCVHVYGLSCDLVCCVYSFYLPWLPT